MIPRDRGRTVDSGGGGQGIGGGQGGGEEENPNGEEEPKGGQRIIKGYRYNKDRSKRIPVYDDGTQGEPEMVEGGGATE